MREGKEGVKASSLVHEEQHRSLPGQGVKRPCLNANLGQMPERLWGGYSGLL